MLIKMLNRVMKIYETQIVWKFSGSDHERKRNPSPCLFGQSGENL
jgi:hypothetical protein